MTVDACCDHRHETRAVRRLREAALPLAFLLKGIVWAWRLVGAPIAGPVCRFEPSCSTYALEAIERFGPFKGAALTAKRLARCHPWGGSGYDPVPDDPARTPPRA